MFNASIKSKKTPKRLKVGLKKKMQVYQRLLGKN